MKYYRETFEDESITPKMHMLEDHVLDFITKWRIGLGMYAEQGGESIHTVFNELRKTYSCMPSAGERLKSMLEQHHMKVRPEARSMIPSPKKRKLTKNEE